MLKKHQRSLFNRIPHAITMLFFIIVLITILTYILPAGTYERVLVDDKMVVVPDSYRIIDATPVGLLEMFKSIPMGFKSAAEVIFIVLAGAIMFGFMESSRAIENTLGVLVKNLGSKNKELVIIIMTLIYGFLGVAVGYENIIAMVPIAAVLSLALGGDLILAAGISVGAMTIGFGLSPINPYTVGTGHKLAELPIFSGAVFKECALLLCIEFHGLLQC